MLGTALRQSLALWLFHWLLFLFHVVEIVRRNADCTLSGFKLCEGILKEPKVLSYTKFSHLGTSCTDIFEKEKCLML